MAETWTYSDWITLDSGSAARLSRLRLHIKEVSDKISSGNFSTEKKSHDFAYLQQYLADLHRQEKQETASSAPAAGQSVTFTRGIPFRDGGCR